MAVDPLSTWKSTLKDLPKVSDGSWAANFAAWYADRIAAIAPSPSALVATGFVFTFQQATFAGALAALGPVLSAAAGIASFAAAWETALLASTAVVGPGTFMPPATPATTFSVVATTLIDLPSIAAGKAKLLELVTAPPVDDADNSLFPEKFRDATLLLTITVSGTNSVAPTPAPLVVPLAALV